MIINSKQYAAPTIHECTEKHLDKKVSLHDTFFAESEPSDIQPFLSKEYLAIALEEIQNRIDVAILDTFIRPLRVLTKVKEEENNG